MTQKFDSRSAIILGMHDALVSLTGLIAGLFVVFSDNIVIILSCIISSITASLSMGAANYLAVKTIDQSTALKSAIYTFIAYMATCAILILPFFISGHRDITMTMVLILAILIIFIFNFVFYRKQNFTKHFFEMLSICTIVSIVAFFIGEIAHSMFGV